MEDFFSISDDCALKSIRDPEDEKVELTADLDNEESREEPDWAVFVFFMRITRIQSHKIKMNRVFGQSNQLEMNAEKDWVLSARSHK